MILYKNILIIRTDRIGDLVLTTPAIQTLKKAAPLARITLLVSAATQDLVKGFPAIDQILIDDRKKKHKGFFGFFRLIQMIKKQQFDLVINYHTKKRTNLLCFLAGIPHRLGFCDKKFGFLLTDKILDRRSLGLKHEIQYCLDVLQKLGITSMPNPPTFVSIQPEAEVWAQQFIAENIKQPELKIIAIHPQASCPTKKWPLQRFIELMVKIQTQYPSFFIIIGAEKHDDIFIQFSQNFEGRSVNVSGETTLPQLVSLLKRCDILISNDSGPVHIADAVGTPVVSIFTRNQPGINAVRWKPIGPNSKFISAPPYEDALFAKSRISNPKHLEFIQTDDVLEAVDSIFKLC